MMMQGSWWLKSDSDPRWDDSGEGIVGGFTPPAEARESVEENQKLLGIDPPADLEWGYTKD